MKCFLLNKKTASLLLALAAHSVSAQSLSQLYEAARLYDASFLSAKADFDATVAQTDQAKAAILPAIGFSATVSRSNFNPAVGTERYFGTRSYGITLSQPIYRPGLLASYNQSLKLLLSADAGLQAAEQSLMIRLAQAYFDVLASRDNLALIRTQKTATKEQLAAARRNFEVGTATITDTNEAQARFDLIHAQEIAAESDLRIKQVTLDQLVGKTNATPNSLNPTATLPVLKEADMKKWIDESEQAHPSVRIAQMALDVAVLENEKSRAGHKPTLDAFISATNNANIGGNSISPNDSRFFLGQAGVTFTLPLFAGFATQNRLKQTLSLEEKARTDWEGTRRSVALSTQSAFLNVISGLNTVAALQTAEQSSQSSLDSNKLGYQVGVRINIDVLNAQAQLYQTKRDLAAARYNVLLGQLKLRQANGTLKEADLATISALLAPTPLPPFEEGTQPQQPQTKSEPAPSAVQ